MRRLALDMGEKRIGVAVSDVTGTVATPLDSLDARLIAKDSSSLRALAEGYEVGELVVGLPLTMSGEEGPQSARVRGEAARLAEELRMPVIFWDERLSSSEAERSLREGGVRGRRSKADIDPIAATLVLQAYLDALKAREGSDRD